MNYVIAAWLSCGALLVLYALRTLRRERVLQRLMGKSPGRPKRPAGQPATGERGRPIKTGTQWR